MQIIFLPILFLSLGFSGCGFADSISVSVTQAVLHPSDHPSFASSAELGKLKQTSLQASGWIEPDPFPIRIASLYDGIVKEVFVLEGERVEIGQKLVSLIDDDARIALRIADARLKEARAKKSALSAEIGLLLSSMNTAESQLSKTKTLRDQNMDEFKRMEGLPRGAVAQIDLNKSKFHLLGMEHSVAAEAAKILELNEKLKILEQRALAEDYLIMQRVAELEKASLDLNRTLITSSFEGSVLRLLTSPGKRLMQKMDSPESSTALILYDPGKLQARIDVPLAEASKIFIGQEVELSSSLLPNMVLKGKLTRIEGEADLQRNTLQVKVRLFEPDERLRPEMLCRAKFLSPMNDEVSKNHSGGLAVFVPKSLKSNDKATNEWLWLVSPDGKYAKSREVTFGNEVVNGYVSVLSGLQAGEKVILNPPSFLKDGDRINILKKP